MRRRTFLGTTALAGAVFGGLQARASPGESCRRFLFLNAEGGWDPLCVFAPLFDADDVEMELAAAPMTIGNLSLVDHPLRPNVRAFFEANHGDIALLNGVSTRSVNHETCQAVALTGATSGEDADWATLLAASGADAHTLPHLVMNGPAFAGAHNVLVSHAQGQLQQAIDGTVLVEGDNELRLPHAVAGRRIDRYLAARSRAILQDYEDVSHVADYQTARVRAKELVDSRLELRLTAGLGFNSRVETAVAALAAGMSRCATVSTGFVWDSHNDNNDQVALFNTFFNDLASTLRLLDTTVGPAGVPLREETIVVVTSEMGRTPAFNATGGRDHWPYTSMMLMGPGVNTGRSYGGYTDLYTGVGVDAGGDPDGEQAGIAASQLGATLLQLGDVDPESLLPGVSPIGGVLA